MSDSVIVREKEGWFVISFDEVDCRNLNRKIE